jgi:hypothetical protein
MNTQQKIAFKNKLKQVCQTIIEERIKLSRVFIENAQKAANSEEKNPAGDKYETGRALGHLEKDMHASQLSENLKELAALYSINTHVLYSDVSKGAFVHCKNLSFFIASGLGKQIIEGETIFFLSAFAPLAKSMLHMKAGENFLFNGVKIEILDVY